RVSRAARGPGKSARLTLFDCGIERASMLAAVLLVLLSGPPEPVEAEPTTEVESTPAVPPPTLVPEQPSERPRRIRRCLPEVEPCYRTTSARLLLASSGVIAAAAAVAIIFEVGDRWRVGDPSVAIVG